MNSDKTPHVQETNGISQNTENEITMDITNKTAEIQEVVRDASPKGDEKVIEEGIDQQTEQRTSPRKSSRLTSTNQRDEAAETFKRTANKNLKETRRSAKISQSESEEVQNVKENNKGGRESENELEPRRSKRNRNKEVPSGAQSPNKLQKNNSKRKEMDQGSEKGLKRGPEKDSDKEKPADTAPSYSGDEYDFENDAETGSTKNSKPKPKPKKNLQKAFDASERTELRVNKQRQDSKQSDTQSKTSVTQKNIEMNRNFDDKVSDKESLEVVEGTDEENIQSETVGSQDNVNTTDEMPPADIQTKMNDSVCSFRTDDSRSLPPNEPKGDAEISLGDEVTQSNDSAEPIEKNSHVTNVKEKTLEIEKGHVSDSSEDEGDGVFLSLSRKSIAIPETQSQPDYDNDEDDDFEMADSPVQKKRISLQPKKSKGTLTPVKTQRGRKLQLQQKVGNRGSCQVESAGKSSKTGSESQNESYGTGKGMEGDTEDAGLSQKAKVGKKRGRTDQESGESVVVTNVKSKSVRAKKSRIHAQSNSDEDQTKRKSKRRVGGKDKATTDDDIPEEEIEPKRNARSQKQSQKANDKRVKQTTDPKRQNIKRDKGANKRDVESKEVETSDSENEVLHDNDVELSDNKRTKEHDSVPRGMPMPVGSSSKPVVRRSRSSLTIVSREPNNAPFTNISRALHTSPSNEMDERQEMNKGTISYCFRNIELNIESVVVLDHVETFDIGCISRNLHQLNQDCCRHVSTCKTSIQMMYSLNKNYSYFSYHSHIYYIGNRPIIYSNLITSNGRL